MVTTRMKKLTVSLPKELVAFADELAKQKKTSRSKVVSACLEEFAERMKIEKMAEGYKALAEEHKKFAEVASVTAHEVLPPWKK